MNPPERENDSSKRTPFLEIRRVVGEFFSVDEPFSIAFCMTGGYHYFHG